MKKGLSLFFALFTLLASAAQIDLQNGDTIEVNPNRYTTVTCSADGNGNGNPISCTEECEKWYTLRTYVNSNWQDVAHCAFKSTCESLSNGCMKKTTCSHFQTTNTYINSHWQDVVTCAGTSTTTTCN